MRIRRTRLPDTRIWLRVADPEWDDPLDPTYAMVRGGRWNPAGSHAVLYTSADVVTARAQIERMLRDSPVLIDDLDDEAYVLVAATLPRSQICADAVTRAGLGALDLPETYPIDADGAEVPRSICQAIGARVKAEGLRGVWSWSAATADRSGRELAWFPATSRSKARAVWRRPLPLSRWRDATGWDDLALDRQPDPTPEGRA